MALASLDRRKLQRETAKRREHEWRDRQASCSEEAAKGIGFAGGEASDPQLCLWGRTRVSADKAVALTKKEFEAWLVDLEVRAEASRLQRGR